MKASRSPTDPSAPRDDDEPPTLTGFAVYHPPIAGMPFLAVAFKSDGTAVALRFVTEADALAYTKLVAKWLDPDVTRH